MKQPPRNKHDSIIDRKFLYKVSLSSFVVLCSTLHIFHHSMDGNQITAYTNTMVRIIFKIIIKKKKKKII